MGFIAQTRKLYRRRVSGNLLAVGTGLQFPVHTFGKLEGALEEAEARVQFLDYQIEDSRQRVALEVRTAYYRLEHAFDQDFRFGSSDGTMRRLLAFFNRRSATISPPERGGG